jgi:hypothetical protein
LLIVTLAFSALAGWGWGPGEAADSTEFDAATGQVERGADQIGQGQVLDGAAELTKGIGNTIVEGAKFSGQVIVEGGRAVGAGAVTVWERTEDAVGSFGSGVWESIVDLLGG